MKSFLKKVAGPIFWKNLKNLPAPLSCIIMYTSLVKLSMNLYGSPQIGIEENVRIQILQNH